MSYWNSIPGGGEVYRGPRLELPNGYQVGLDYVAVSKLMELVQVGIGTLELGQVRAGRGGDVRRYETIDVVSDGERMLFEYSIGWPREDLFVHPGGQPVTHGKLRDFFTKDESSVQKWQWSLGECVRHLSTEL